MLSAGDAHEAPVGGSVESSARACLVRPRPQPGAAHRLYCFPWSGAGPAVFDRWAEQLPPTVELVAVQLPGRAGRRHEVLEVELGRMARAVAEAMREEPAGSCAFYGHSLGALLAFEVLLRLQHNDTGIEALIASGSRAPVCPPPRPLHEFHDTDLVRRLIAMGGISPQRLRDREFTRRVLPVIKADLTACETYTAPRGAAITCPVITWSGAEDWYAPQSTMRQWADVTARPEAVTHRSFPGGHFFVHAVPADLALAELGWPRTQTDWSGASARTAHAA
ncbi:thioesterase [Lentzea sp. NBRC 105346]|nr:thioesterase domain-containing protein [Lentzea sp. NBRC 105346]GLZ28176.1 thioesterase [Lentzea sp. NBRC 105346]